MMPSPVPLRLALLGLLAALTACQQKPASAAKPPPVVGVQLAQPVDLPQIYGAQGHVVSLNQVDIRPQVNGIVRQVAFHEGDVVKAGQLLFVLEDADASATLTHSKAQLAQYRAQLSDAERDARRSIDLAASGFLSHSAADTAGSKADALRAQVQAAQADVTSAEVQLGHTRIYAPISGRTGTLNVHAGSLAQPGATLPLLTLYQFDPIAVEFTLPEQSLKAVLAAKAAGQGKVTLDGAQPGLPEGQLSFINSTVSSDNGTITLKATFPNRDQQLWPGSFVQLRLAAGVSQGVYTLPPQAILDDKDGQFVYVVGSKGTAEKTRIQQLRLQDAKAVVTGLKPGMPVIVEGAQSVKPGGTVHAQPYAPAAKAAA